MSRGAALLAMLRRQLLEPEYPLLAVEVRARALGVVRVQRQAARLTLAAAVQQDLPPGCLALSAAGPNVTDRAAFVAALRTALERAGAAGANRACLVLPDPVARLSLVPAAELVGKRAAERAELIRFRLRRTLPFDPREARLAHAPLGAAEAAGGALPVVAAAHVVVQEYEGLLAEAGLHAGLVELAGLVCLAAALRSRPPGEDRVVVNWDDSYLSLFVARAGRLVLARTLALPEDGQAGAADAQREAFNTLLYYRERLGGEGVGGEGVGGERLGGVSLRSAALPAEQAVTLLREALEVEPEPLDPWASVAREAPAAGAGPALPGALVPGLAAVLGRAA